ncbi:MAG: DNA repair protein RecN [Inquilinus sp.]|nr:DNA repair protein RecN [Inquilinus sp.]
MLIGLSIRNVVLIEQLDISFGGGLCALTGETGAGKSILLDALGLALGARSDSALVRHGADQAAVAAEFDLSDDHAALALLRDRDLDVGDTLLLRRTVGSDGRSRAFVNDQPVGVALLREIGETLVEIHGQFDNTGLLNPRTHRDLLDGYAGLWHRADQTAAAWRAWRRLEEECAEAEAKASEARAEVDYLRHAVAELEALAPEPGEEDTVAEQRSILMHREKLLEAIEAALGAVGGEDGAERSFGTASRHLQRVADKAGGRIDPILEAIDRAAAETAEAAALLQSLNADIDLDVGELEKLEERLFALRAAARKYGVDIDALPALRDELAGKLLLVEGQEESLGRLAKQAAMARDQYREAAKVLTEARRQATVDLDRAIAAELPPLKLEKARFETSVAALPEAEWGPAGQDRVAFQVATNPGAPLGPLNRIASGGELARFMLALKVVLARSGTVPTLVFDEVDSGISGAVAAAVGERLDRLGRQLQVLVVTHSPQVAARAGRHLRVAKAAAGGHTVTTVQALEEGERREEIARMLSGAEVTDQARAAADTLIAARPA